MGHYSEFYEAQDRAQRKRQEDLGKVVVPRWLMPWYCNSAISMSDRVWDSPENLNKLIEEIRTGLASTRF